MKINLDGLTNSNNSVVKNKACGCPGGREMSFAPQREKETTGSVTSSSKLRQWPVQLHLLNPEASYFKNADVVLAADCTAYAYGDFHHRFMKNHVLAIACPKLDNGTESYVEKLTAMIDNSFINTLTVVIMEVPCCNGLLELAKRAVANATRKIPIKKIIIGIKGDVLQEEWVF